MQLKPFVARFFNSLNGVQKAFETDLNTYIVQLLGVVEAMTRLGFYTDEDDLILIVDPLISLLDGSLDIIDIDQLTRGNSSPEQPSGKDQTSNNNSYSMNSRGKDSEEAMLRAKRYKINESNLLLTDTKNQIFQILQLILNIQNDVRLTEFLTAFNADGEQLSDEQVKFIMTVNKTKKLPELFKKDEAAEAMRADFTSRVVTWMNTSFENKKLDLERISRSDFVCVLLDLILYENTTLVSNAFKLLIRFFQQKKAIIDLAQTV